ncbi:MAG: asparagine--tRNA ligase [Acidobacteria bacterium]|nr:asparagine--tRNA ligase [Acidobacteriota bacterium]MBV9476244.1 asparagine--tRNA ligase [Acidobacteriota bacterium]
MATTTVRIKDLPQYVGETVTVNGWLYNKRSSGKLQFPIVRDGSGVVQCVVSKKEVDETSWNDSDRATQESTLAVTGNVVSETRAPGGVELHVKEVRLIGLADAYPISPKEHGTDFLMNHRHLWLRSMKQHHVLLIRNEIEKAIRDFYYDRNFVLIDSPILTANAAEGTSTLFETDYFGDKAYLSQSGQLYLEPAAAAFGKVYCFGPTFRAEKSKTRRHLMEFWMVEPEVAFLDFDGLQALAEEFIEYIVGRVLERQMESLKELERDITKLEQVKRPFPRITYRDAIELLKSKGMPANFGDDIGGDEETVIANSYDRPVIITRYPAAIKAFYMQPDPNDPELALGMDMIAPEGYGEIIGGSQRIHDHDLLLQRIQEHGLPVDKFQWYLDVRKYGTFPHSGFGMGVERVVAWISGVPHLRETIPYPRMLNRIYP